MVRWVEKPSFSWCASRRSQKFPAEASRKLRRRGVRVLILWRFGLTNKYRCFFDNIKTGFVVWSKTVKGYRPSLDGQKNIEWHGPSQPALQVIQQSLTESKYLQQLASLWGQEANQGGSLEVRPENTAYFKYLGMSLLPVVLWQLIRVLAKFCGARGLDTVLAVADSLLFNSEKFKQRAGAEIMAGILRGVSNCSKYIQTLNDFL